MRLVKGIFVFAFVVTLFSSCMEEDYVKPINDIVDTQSGSDPRPAPAPKPGDV